MAETSACAARRREDGFTLLEVLVAFAILTFALSALLLAFATGLRTTGRSAAIATATLQAQSLMDQVGNTIPLREADLSGVLEDGARWKVAVVPFDTGDFGGAAYRVEIDVASDGGRSVTLTSLRLAPAHD